MDTRLLDAYNRELRQLQEQGAEFAAQYPEIARGLDLANLRPKDPFVERLLEGFAFLAARVQVKLDARHPDFTQHLLEIVYPDFLAPVPACAIAEFVPDIKGGSLEPGVRIPRGSDLSTVATRTERTVCQFRTAHEVVLWPLELREARYLAGSGAVAGQGLVGAGAARAALRLKFVAPEGVALSALAIDELTFFIKPTPDLSARLHEQVVTNVTGVAVRSPSDPSRVRFLPASVVTPVGLDDEEAMLPLPRAGFGGYRLLQEYFAMPDRLLFFKVAGLREALRDMKGGEFEIALLFDRDVQSLDGAVDESHLRLNCTPIVNLFPRSADRVHVTAELPEMHLTVDRNRPMDFEVHSILAMQAIGGDGALLAPVQPMYRTGHGSVRRDEAIHYTVQRRSRLRSIRQQQSGTRAPYLGSEVYVSVADGLGRQFTGELRQLDTRVLCTNRDLPTLLSLGKSSSDFTLQGSVPLEAVRCLVGPTPPRAAPAFGDTAWRLLGHLSLNYLSLTSDDGAGGAMLLRDLLNLYADPNDGSAHRQREGVRTVSYAPVVRRIPGAGPIVYGRGLEITLGLEDGAFAGTGIVPLALVLERFFARYASINSFTQLRLESSSRGLLKRWPARVGRRHVL